MPACGSDSAHVRGAAPAAISSCKNSIESLFQIILDRSDVAYSRDDAIPDLYRRVADLLALSAEALPDSARASQT